MTERVEETRMDPGGLKQGKVRSQEVTTSTLDTPSTFRSISPEKSAQIFTHIAPFCMGALDLERREYAADYRRQQTIKLGGPKSLSNVQKRGGAKPTIQRK